MGALAAAQGQFPAPSSLAGIGEATAREFARPSSAERIRGVIREAGLTVARLSAIPRLSFGPDSACFIPPTFLSKLNRGISPHICQLTALSWVTHQSLTDCMSLCGFDLQSIFPAQLQLHTERTVLVTPGVADCASAFPPFSSGRQFSAASSRYLFARIGQSDAAVCPKLVSGSVLRLDRHPAQFFHRNVDSTNGGFWLVEHSAGLTCCQVKRVGHDHVVLLPHRPPFSAWPLRLESEARILGMVGTEEPFQKTASPRPFDCDEKFRAFLPKADCASSLGISRLLRTSRRRAGLTLRAAHAMTIAVAQLLGNPEHHIALGLLSDYEASDKLPRHIAKIMTLCIVYSIDFWELLRTDGIAESVHFRSFLPNRPQHDKLGSSRESLSLIEPARLPSHD